MMRIGISLPWYYLAEIYDKTAACRTVYRDCSETSVFLKRLAEHGCSSIELRHWYKELTEKDLEKSFKNITDSGLEYSIHGDIDKKHLNEDIYKSFPWLDAAVNGLKNSSQRILTVTIHPVKEKGGDTEKLKKLSEEIISGYCSEIEKYSLPVKIAYENQREKGFADPALHFTRISDSVKKIGRKELGTCWDMGHSYANFLKNNYTEIPDNDFLESAIHTHIHDLSDGTGATHWPLTCGNVPIEKYVHLLKKYSYSGVFNLELSAERFDNLNVEKYILKSMDILKGYLT